jgi:hypothetical protein
MTLARLLALVERHADGRSRKHLGRVRAESPPMVPALLDAEPRRKGDQRSVHVLRGRLRAKGAPRAASFPQPAGPANVCRSRLAAPRLHCPRARLSYPSCGRHYFSFLAACTVLRSPGVRASYSDRLLAREASDGYVSRSGSGCETQREVAVVRSAPAACIPSTGHHVVPDDQPERASSQPKPVDHGSVVGIVV